MRFINSTSRVIGAALVLALLSACSPLHDPMYRRITPDAANPIKTVAVLPLINNTNDVEAPGHVREELILRMQAMQYAVKPALQTDQVLRDQLGITLGRQLDMATVQQLGEALGVDGLMFGVLDDFSTKVAAVLTEKRVRVRFSLVRTSDGSQFWANGVGVIGRTRVKGGVSGQVATGLEAASRVEAAKESAEQARRATGAEPAARLPGGLDHVPTPWVTIPTVEIGGDREKHKGKEGENVAAGLMLGLGEELVEKAVGKPLYQEVRLMMNLVVRPDAVAALEAAALQRLERRVVGGTTTKEQLAMEIATKAAEVNTIRLLRPLPVGPGSLPFAVPAVQEPTKP
ncbi:MAG TPA: GNA1162 family protein [Nitrospiraceae bacterium]|nr:GNA1162 family protein [Nitrospiraceae bacterium]